MVVEIGVGGTEEKPVTHRKRNRDLHSRAVATRHPSPDRGWNGAFSVSRIMTRYTPSFTVDAPRISSGPLTLRMEAIRGRSTLGLP